MQVSSYVQGAIPQALQLKYGYFLVKNRSTKEVKAGRTVHQGFEAETKWFGEHAIYGKLMSSGRIGIPPLGQVSLTSQLCCYDEIKGNQDLKICSHADSLLSHQSANVVSLLLLRRCLEYCVSNW